MEKKSRQLFPALQVEVMEKAMEYRRHENCHREDQNKSAEHRIQSCEDFSTISVENADRSHATHEHCRIEECIDQAKALK